MAERVDQWEYFSTFLEADAAKLDSGMAKGVPPGDYPKFTPYSLIPELNEFGANGWELVSAAPVMAGRNHDFVVPAGDAGRWGHHYFCVFKRRLT